MSCRTYSIQILVACSLILMSGRTEVSGQITILSQSRSVSADATIACSDSIVDSSSASTTTGVSFIQSVSESMSGAEANTSGGICIGTTETFSSSASQNSAVAPVVPPIVSIVEGIGSASAGKSNGALENGSANAASTLSVDFQVVTSSPYLFSGEVDGVESSVGGFFLANANVSLVMGSTTIHSVDANAPDLFGLGTLNTFSFAGTLAPGLYTLSASATANISGSLEGADSASFSFNFVPEPNATLWTLLLTTGLMARRRHRRVL